MAERAQALRIHSDRVTACREWKVLLTWEDEGVEDLIPA